MKIENLLILYRIKLVFAKERRIERRGPDDRYFRPDMQRSFQTEKWKVKSFLGYNRLPQIKLEFLGFKSQLQRKKIPAFQLNSVNCA